MTEIQKTYVVWKVLRAKAFTTLFASKLLIELGRVLVNANLCPRPYLILTGKVTFAAADFTQDANEALENLKGMLR